MYTTSEKNFKHSENFSSNVHGELFLCMVLFFEYRWYQLLKVVIFNYKDNFY